MRRFFPRHTDPFLCVVQGAGVGGLLLLNLSGDGASSVGCATWQVPD